MSANKANANTRRHAQGQGLRPRQSGCKQAAVRFVLIAHRSRDTTYSLHKRTIIGRSSLKSKLSHSDKISAYFKMANALELAHLCANLSRLPAVVSWGGIDGGSAFSSTHCLTFVW